MQPRTDLLITIEVKVKKCGMPWNIPKATPLFLTNVRLSHEPISGMLVPSVGPSVRKIQALLA